MNRFLLGGFGALLLFAAGLFWFQGRATQDAIEAPPPPEPDLAVEPVLPVADVKGMRGPAPPEATERSREQRRFDRQDRNGDGIISRVEMMSNRTAAFKKIDTDGNNLLTFEEWAVTTSNRFAGADRNRDGQLSREEFAATKPKPKKPGKCDC